MQKNQTKNRGFSFAETVVVVAILIILLIALLGIYLNYSKVYTYQQALIKTSNSARIAMNELRSAALQSDKIIDSYSFSGTTYSSNENTLVLEIPSIDGSGNIVSGKYDYAVFYTSGTNLYKRVQPESSSSRPSGTKQLSDTVAMLSFAYNNADLAIANKVDADIRMQAAAGKQTATYNLQQAIYLRNK